MIDDLIDKFKLVEVEIVQCESAKDLPLPAYATEGSAGMDLCANVEPSVILKPMERTLVPTGLFIALPSGYEAQVRPRSGLAAKCGVTVLNTPGTIDSDYRGEIKVILINLSHENFIIERGMRIAQMVIKPIISASIKVVTKLSSTKRGDGGFGSTGTKALHANNLPFAYGLIPYPKVSKLLE